MDRFCIRRSMFRGARAANTGKAILEPTRVLLVEIPNALQRIIEAAFVGDPAFTFVAEESDEPAEVAAAVDREGAGFVVVWAEQPELPWVFRRLLEERPRTKMLAVAGDGRENFLYLPLGQLSPRGLAAAIRSAVDSRRCDW
jgi:hypothetical protein